MSAGGETVERGFGPVGAALREPALGERAG